MQDTRITVEELEAAMAGELKGLFGEVVAAMNRAAVGRIIADSEEPVRDANAAFRQQLFEKAVRLLQDKQEAFSPSAEGPAEQGSTDDDAPEH